MGFSSRVEVLPVQTNTSVAQRCSNQSLTSGGTLATMEEEAEQPPEPANRQNNDSIDVSDDDNDSISSTSSVDDVKSSEEEVCSPSETAEESLVACALPKFTTPPSFSYVSPKLTLRKSATGSGLFASVPIRRDEVIVSWSGRVVHVNEVYAMKESERTYILQIDEELFQIPPWKGYNEPADFTNHSCDPNAGFRFSPSTLVAMRDIAPGEEIAFDYAMCECIDGLKGNEFECCCGTRYCRGQFTGHDWKNPQLWARYGDYFSPYLREKIKQYRAEICM